MIQKLPSLVARRSSFLINLITLQLSSHAVRAERSSPGVWDRPRWKAKCVDSKKTSASSTHFSKITSFIGGIAVIFNWTFLWLNFDLIKEHIHVCASELSKVFWHGNLQFDCHLRAVLFHSVSTYFKQFQLQEMGNWAGCPCNYTVFTVRKALKWIC